MSERVKKAFVRHLRLAYDRGWLDGREGGFDDIWDRPSVRNPTAGRAYERAWAWFRRWLDREDAAPDRTAAEVQERLEQHEENLRPWTEGYLDPTEPDAEERRATRERLRAAIRELEWVLGERA